MKTFDGISDKPEQQSIDDKDEQAQEEQSFIEKTSCFVQRWGGVVSNEAVRAIVETKLIPELNQLTFEGYLFANAYTVQCLKFHVSFSILN